MVVGRQEGANLEVRVEYFSLSDTASDTCQLFYENQGWNTSLNSKEKEMGIVVIPDTFNFDCL